MELKTLEKSKLAKNPCAKSAAFVFYKGISMYRVLQFE